jgi:hypothetical protein
VPGTVGQVVETPKSGRVPQVGAKPYRAEAWSGSGEIMARQSCSRLRADGWCRAQCNDESGDGRITRLDDLTGAGWSPACTYAWEGSDCGYSNSAWESGGPMAAH